MNRQEAHSSLPWRAVLSHEQQPQLLYRGLICVLERSPDQWTSVVAASGEAGADRETIDANAHFIVTAVNHHHALVQTVMELRNACAAAMRVVADLDLAHCAGFAAETRQQRFMDEVRLSGVRDGFGKRADDLLAQIDREQGGA